jgi:hypothetical protein
MLHILCCMLCHAMPVSSQCPVGVQPVFNRQISVGGVQKTPFPVPDGRWKCPNHPDKNPEKSEILSKLTLPKKQILVCTEKKK